MNRLKSTVDVRDGYCDYLNREQNKKKPKKPAMPLANLILIDMLFPYHIADMVQNIPMTDVCTAVNDALVLTVSLQKH